MIDGWCICIDYKRGSQFTLVNEKCLQELQEVVTNNKVCYPVHAHAVYLEKCPY
jgi:hypothetical protein